MKHVIKQVDTSKNLNVSNRSPLKTFFMILAGLFISIVVLFTVLVFSLETIMPHMPAGVEKYIGKLVRESYLESGYDKTKTKKAQEILKELTSDEYQIYVVDSDEFNAFALPGKTIVINTPILNSFDQNVLEFVIAHELGHFANNDHMKGLGRKLAKAVILAVFINRSGSEGIDTILSPVNLAFSRDAEYRADLYAMELLDEKGLDLKGGITFLEYVLDAEGDSFTDYFSTHPNSQKRIERMRGYIENLD